MEQKTTLVKKILNAMLEIFSGFLVFLPVLVLVQNYAPVQEIIIHLRNKWHSRLPQQLADMCYFIYALCLPFLWWFAGQKIWRSKNIAIGFLLAFLIHITGAIIMALVLIFSPK